MAKALAEVNTLFGVEIRPFEDGFKGTREITGKEKEKQIETVHMYYNKGRVFVKHTITDVKDKKLDGNVPCDETAVFKPMVGEPGLKMISFEIAPNSRTSSEASVNFDKVQADVSEFMNDELRITWLRQLMDQPYFNFKLGDDEFIIKIGKPKLTKTGKETLVGEVAYSDRYTHKFSMSYEKGELKLTLTDESGGQPLERLDARLKLRVLSEPQNGVELLEVHRSMGGALAELNLVKQQLEDSVTALLQFYPPRQWIRNEQDKEPKGDFMIRHA